MFRKTAYKTRLVSLLILFSVLGVVGQISAQEIEKCQDEQGNWHYGNFAAAECALSSDITTLNESGSAIGVEKPPPTEEELTQAAAIKKAEAKAASEREKQIKFDQNLVQIYGSEEVILSTRDRKLTSIDNNLEVTRQLKQGVVQDILALKKRNQTAKVKLLIEERQKAIISYNKVIEHTLFERKKLEDSYVMILDRFRKATARLEGG